MEKFLSNYLNTLGLGGLIGGLVIEAMGLPFPGDVMIMFSGFLVNQQHLDLVSVYTAAVVGFNIGALAAFYIGRRMGEGIFDHYGKYLRAHRYRLERARSWMRRSAATFIIAGRFIPMVSNLIPYLAGASGLKWSHFILYNLVFTLLWVSVNLSVGMFFGHNWPLIAGYFQNRLSLAVLTLLLCYLALKYVISYVHATRSERI